jgi:hypothetical protein
MSSHAPNPSHLPRPHIGPAYEDAVHRERFDAHELAMVLSHYEIGVIEHRMPIPQTFIFGKDGKILDSLPGLRPDFRVWAEGAIKHALSST